MDIDSEVYVSKGTNDKTQEKYNDDNIHDIINEINKKINEMVEEIKTLKEDKDVYNRKKYNSTMYRKRVEKMDTIKCECGKEFREDRKVYHLSSNYHKKRMENNEQ